MIKATLAGMQGQSLYDVGGCTEDTGKNAAAMRTFAGYPNPPSLGERIFGTGQYRSGELTRKEKKPDGDRKSSFFAGKSIVFPVTAVC